MSFSQMSSREKTIIAVLGVVILLALVGIGVLAAKLITDNGGNAQATEVGQAPTGGAMAPTQASPVDSSPAGQAPSGETPAAASPDSTAGEATITPVAPPALAEPDQQAPMPSGGQPLVVGHSEGIGPLAPVILASQPLQAGHRYRIEIRAADGSNVAIHGSWSQAATSASGTVAAPQIEFFEGATPHRIEIVPPVADPVMWSCSVSAALKDGLGQSTSLVIEIVDATGVP